MGDWKAVRQNLRPRPPATPTIKTELYHLAVDPTEQNDVAAQQPELVARMEKLLREQHTPSKEFPLPALDR